MNEEKKDLLAFEFADALEAEGYFELINGWFRSSVGDSDTTFDPMVLFTAYMSVVARACMYQAVKIAGIVGEFDKVENIANKYINAFIRMTTTLASLDATKELFDQVKATTRGLADLGEQEQDAEEVVPPGTLLN